MNPLDTCGIRHKAVEPYTLAESSLNVPRGTTLCVPAYSILYDHRIYPDQDTFRGDRFALQPQNLQSRFATVSPQFPMWGYGSLACLERFHATMVIKIALSQLLLNYDLLLEKESVRNGWYWETFALPYESTRIVLNPRNI
ncbi:cytochrome P450 [Periconia macrospinosa]|uniref:Cytochrome P450 n=1 Tax=Periconia macrospinosa TaxID=97972 RepID=A0A2V1D3F3_9PLEO|nr:cytochrome P450 [Periconia macrospinosa]